MKMLSIISTLIAITGSLSLSTAMVSCGQGHREDKDSTAVTRSATDSKAKTRESGGATADFAYRLDQPTAVYTLPEELTEVSGIRFLSGADPHIYAEQDEKGRLYQLLPGDKTAKYFDFGKDGDYEDLVFSGGKAIFLRSDGDLFSFKLPATLLAGGDASPHLDHYSDLVPKGEYEGLYADTARSQLYMLCKNCSGEDHKKSVGIHRLDFDGGRWVKAATYQVDVTRISQLLNAEKLEKNGGKKKHGPKNISFKPSAICRNPATGEWYLLSSINKVLVVTGSDWQVKSVQPLPAKLYPQPEGMCFDKAGNLYISNEGQKPGGATLLKFAPGS